MAVVDSIILVIIGAGALVGFIKGFVKQLATLLGLVVGLVAAKTLYASVAEKVFSRITDSMTVAQVLAFIASGASGFCVDSFAADEGDGSRVARLAEPLAGFRAGSAESTSAGEFAGGRYRIYRFGQYAAQSNKKERIGVILSHEVICRNILSCSKGCYGTDCEWRCGLIRNL